MDVVLVTDTRNGEKEDAFIAEQLGLQVCDLYEAAERLPEAELYFVRNVWPGEEKKKAAYMGAKNAFRQGVQKRGRLMRNALDGRADMRGKHHLVQLYSEGYPVIPTVKEKEHIDGLGDVGMYVIKPLDGLSGWGMRAMGKRELMQADTSGCVIQPRVQFSEEVSFFFVDNAFVYASRTRDRMAHAGMEEYAPPKSEIALAERFVAWNTLTRGIQRIDFCRTDAGLLLVEIEDDCPFLFLLDMSERTQERMLAAMRKLLL